MLSRPNILPLNRGPASWAATTGWEIPSMNLAKAEDDAAQAGRGQSQDGGFETKAQHDNDPAQGPEQWHGPEHQNIVA